MQLNRRQRQDPVWRTLAHYKANSRLAHAVGGEHFLDYTLWLNSREKAQRGARKNTTFRVSNPRMPHPDPRKRLKNKDDHANDELAVGLPRMG